MGRETVERRNDRRVAAGEATEGEITDPRVYRMRLGLMFGIQLSAAEVEALGLFPPREG